MLMDAYRECITLGDDNFIENLVIIILNIRDSNIPYLYKYIWTHVSNTQLVSSLSRHIFYQKVLVSVTFAYGKSAIRYYST